MSRHNKNNRGYKKYLDEVAIAGSGAGVVFSASQYVSARKELHRAYTKNAYQVAGKKFNHNAYKKYLNNWINKEIIPLSRSKTAGKRGVSLLADVYHLSPRKVSPKSRKLIGRSSQKLKTLQAKNWKSFKKIMPKRAAYFTLGLAGAVTVPGVVRKIQGDKQWKDTIKDSAIQTAAPIVAGTGAGLLYLSKNPKLIKRLF